MDLPNFSKPGSVTEQAPQNTKKKLAIFGGVGVFLLAIVGAYFFLSTPSASSEGPPSLEVQSKGIQGRLEEKDIGFLLPEKADIDAFKERKNSFLKDITPNKLTLAKGGLQYVYIYNSDTKQASFQDVVDNIDLEAARILFVAKWDAKDILFETTNHNYFVKEKNGKTVTRIASALTKGELEKVKIQPAGGALLAIAASTEIYGFNDGNTFAKTPYGICDTNKANGWHLFASHTKDATELFKDCKPGQIKEFHIQTGLDPVVFKASAQDAKLTYSMVWVDKGDEVKGAAKEDKAAADKAAADKAAADKAAADKAAADAKTAADAKAAADKAAADAKTAADAKAAADAAAKGKTLDDHIYTISPDYKNVEVTWSDGSGKAKYNFDLPKGYTVAAISDQGGKNTLMVGKKDGKTDAVWFDFTIDKKFPEKINALATASLSGTTIVIKEPVATQPAQDSSTPRATDRLGVKQTVVTTNTEVKEVEKKTYDLEFTLNGTTLTVQWFDGTKSPYTIVLPKGYNVTQPMLGKSFVNIITIKDEKGAPRSNIVPDDGKLKNIFINDEDEKELNVVIGANQITVTSNATSHSDIVKVFQGGGLVWEKVKWSDTKWGQNNTYKLSCNNSAKVNATDQTDDDWSGTVDTDNECYVGKDSHVVEQHAKTGDMNFAYKIYLTEEAKSKLVASDDNDFYFKTAYKRQWTEKGDDTGVLHEGDIINFELKPGGKLDLSNDSDSAVKNNVVYESDGAIYVRVFVPWPGLALGDYYNDNSDGDNIWGKTDVDMYFFEVANNVANTFVTKTAYRVEEFKKPNLYLNVTASGCTGLAGDWDFQVGNSGGFLPVTPYNRIQLYTTHYNTEVLGVDVATWGHGPETLYKSFGIADSPEAIRLGGGKTSDHECLEIGTGDVYLVRDGTTANGGKSTIWKHKYSP